MWTPVESAGLSVPEDLLPLVSFPRFLALFSDGSISLNSSRPRLAVRSSSRHRIQSSACAPGRQPEDRAQGLSSAAIKWTRNTAPSAPRAGTNVLQANMRKMNTCEKTGRGYPAFFSTPERRVREREQNQQLRKRCMQVLQNEHLRESGPRGATAANVFQQVRSSDSGGVHRTPETGDELLRVNKSGRGRKFQHDSLSPIIIAFQNARGYLQVRFLDSGKRRWARANK